MYKNSPWLGGSFLVLEVVGEVCLRLTLGVLLLMLICQSVGLVKIASRKLSVVEHVHTDDLLSGVHKDYNLQEVWCMCFEFCMWNFD